MSDRPTKDAVRSEVLLVNLGTPAAPTPGAVRAFLAEFLSDPCVVHWPRALWLPILHGIVLRRRPARVAQMYEQIWTPEGSPLALETQALAAGLQERLGGETRVTAAFRYGRPSLEERLDDALRRSREVLAMPLFPQRTASSSGSIELCLRTAARSLGAPLPRILNLTADAPGYIEALASRVREAQADQCDSLLISFHGIPASVDRREGRVYSQDCERTAEALRTALGRSARDAPLCYQSRFGPGRWLGPATADLLAELPGRGVRSVGVVAPGFLTDGLETIEELGERGRATFQGAGGEDFRLAASCAAHPALLDELAELVRGSQKNQAR